LIQNSPLGVGQISRLTRHNASVEHIAYRRPLGGFARALSSYQTCHRRFQQWVRSGVMRGVLEALAEDLYVRGGFQLLEAFIDGSFAPANKGA
jgi:hypothetical protein